MFRIFKKLIPLGLSFFLVFDILHADEYHDHLDSYSICNQDCSDRHHHSVSHYCEECYIESNNVTLIPSNESLSNIEDLNYTIGNYAFNKSYQKIILYIRPPPKFFL